MYFRHVPNHTTTRLDPAKSWLVKMKTLLMILLPVAVTVEDEKIGSLEKKIITRATGARVPRVNRSK